MFLRRETESRLPSGLWGHPNRRILSPVHIDLFTTDVLRVSPSPLIGFAGKQISHLIRANRRVHNVTDILSASNEDPSAGMVDVEMSTTTAAATNKTAVVRFLNSPLSAAVNRVRILNEKDASHRLWDGRGTAHVLRIDLRRLIIPFDRFEAPADLAALATICLDRLVLWSSVEDVRVEFVVRAEPVARIVEETIVASEVEEEIKRRCVVIIVRPIPMSG